MRKKKSWHRIYGCAVKKPRTYYKDKLSSPFQFYASWESALLPITLHVTFSFKLFECILSLESACCVQYTCVHSFIRPCICFLLFSTWWYNGKRSVWCKWKWSTEKDLIGQLFRNRSVHIACPCTARKKQHTNIVWCTNKYDLCLISLSLLAICFFLYVFHTHRIRHNGRRKQWPLCFLERIFLCSFFFLSFFQLRKCYVLPHLMYLSFCCYCCPRALYKSTSWTQNRHQKLSSTEPKP